MVRVKMCTKILNSQKKQHLKIIFFLPFSDLTSGKESYIGGRYIDLKFERKTIAVDFNLAYNPYCATI
jgi:uncharacterized protein (DUF1684 family)